MYVAVRHGLLVICSASSWRSSSQYIQYMFEGVAGSVLVAAGQRYLQRCSHRDGPVIAHGPDDSSFNIEGIADHITQASCSDISHLLEERKAVLVTTFDDVAIRESDGCICQLAATAERLGQPQRCVRGPPEVRSTAQPHKPQARANNESDSRAKSLVRATARRLRCGSRRSPPIDR